MQKRPLQSRWRVTHVTAPLAITVLLAAPALAADSPSPTSSGPRLSGRVVVEWSGEDAFIYRRRASDPLVFVTSNGKRIEPRDMYTDGGSVPRVFHAVPGLSPWGLGPAYIVHDWLFHLHRCGTPEDRARFTFEQTADILSEVARELVKAQLVPNSGRFIRAITAAVKSGAARQIWNKPYGTECKTPPALAGRLAPLRLPMPNLWNMPLEPAVPNAVVDFAIPRY